MSALAEKAVRNAYLLMRRLFAVEVLACPRCEGRMRVLATLEDPRVIRKILEHVGLPAEAIAARPPPVLSADWE
jgi:hypothetical protein